MYRTTRGLATSGLLLALALAGCRQEAEVPGGTAGPDASVTPAAADTAAAAPVALEDVMETDPRYIVGISYPPGMDRYPGLAAELRRYADAARADLMEAVEAHDPAEGGERIPYDLTLAYDVLMETPTIVAVQAWGTLYTGGAHGNPLVARFVWLPQRKEMLRAEKLVAGEDGWREVSAFCRESLHAALSQRLDADDVAPADRVKLMRSGSEMIDDGTGSLAENFGQFEPLPGEGGRLRGLRFVFPPYQVGPYSDGMQTVEVPASVLLPHLAPEYRDLFAAG
ncbi:DUF3298 and DUF4163 domain-containing protein [Luteimonas sp. MC1750]|uniref:DUF3298 and DUF4163 domain-containing protein n=1 Tax=Luteimonas sp. MC1750 TaxID=2799326 RepID=UPI0018F0DACA|nr:DUF3298 and DUF4163 domain-containing protein [Luteimonas sp. MC1750]MBJ6984138.1 DUF3298 domain-containing protein [Luteimonas sp. MC1750]QQO06941.1 DUF3298 domain-containing protein [Luteimonas sp. MC1750]